MGSLTAGEISRAAGLQNVINRSVQLAFVFEMKRKTVFPIDFNVISISGPRLATDLELGSRSHVDPSTIHEKFGEIAIIVITL